MKPYSKDSVARALRHHQAEGALHKVTLPWAGNPRYRVQFTELDVPVDLTLKEAWLLVEGLARGQEHYVRVLGQRDAAFVSQVARHCS